ncbi:MAG: c-type cytochrome [Gemmatimonadetes bacterium]|nr:c-type cytochrome [Gemmatimonadota bacterium]
MSYPKAANIAGIVKVNNAMVAQGVNQEEGTMGPSWLGRMTLRSMTRFRIRAHLPLISLTAFLPLSMGLEAAQVPQDLDVLSDQALYQASCANCHGADGRGLDRSLVGFEEAIPDFTDCDFAAREPDADWIAVAHEGGPVRGFSRMMPAFRGALTKDQIGRVIRYIRTLCTNPSWPSGELNLPRALATEKAYPEDEWVVEGGLALADDGAISSAFVYEQRFGPRSQFEVVIPFGWRELPGTEENPGATRWVSGLGDVVLGVKHAAYHNVTSGTIVSVGGEIILPTGDESKGLGADGGALEFFGSLGQILPSDAFLQAQAGFEIPLYSGAANEAFGRLVLGRGFSRGDWGRSWTPMIELLAKRDLEGDATTALDLVPQIQFSLNTRQHVLANIGLLVPATHTTGRSVRLLAYVLLDWFDGGFFEGW